MTLRLLIQQRLTECLEEITPDLGTEWWEDIGEPFDMRPQGEDRPCVFRGRNRFGESDPEELLSILEPPIPLEAFLNRAADNTNSNADWELLVQGFCVGDPDGHATDRAQQFLEAVKKKLREEMRRQMPHGQGDMDILGLGVGSDPRGSIDKLTIGQGVCRPADETSERSFFWLLVKLQVVEKAV